MQAIPANEANKPVFLHEPEVEEEKLQLLEYWRSVQKRKWSILGLALVGALLAAVISFVTTPIYRSTATILFEPNKARVLSLEDVYTGGSSAQNREDFQTQFEILRSREVLTKAVAKSRLWDHPDYDPRKPKESLLTRFGLGAQSAPEKAWTEAEMAEALVGTMSAMLTVEPVPRSRLVKISFETTDRELSARLANTLAGVYIDNDLEARYAVTQRANEWLQGQLGGLKDKLSQSEKALQSFREREGIIDIKTSAQSGTAQQVQDAMGRLVDARVRRIEAESAYKQVTDAPKGTELSSLPALLRNTAVAEAKNAEAQAVRKLAEVSQRYGSEHPRYVQAASELESAKVNLKRQVDSVVQTLKREYELARNLESTLAGMLGSAKGSVQSMNRKEAELGVLEREVQANQQMYELFLKRANDASGTLELQTPIARITDPARIPAAAAKPNNLLYTGIGLALGLILGLLAAILRDRLDNTLKTSEDVEARLKQPILTTLPLLSKQEMERTQTACIFVDQPDSIYSESIRTARTGVLLSGIDSPRRTLLVTSSVPGEGKTTFSINLALAHAHTKKTLLIDADMRRPMVAKGLKVGEGAKGLSNFVSGTAELQECMVPVDDSTLMLMPSGSVPPNPLELLLSQRFKDTLAELEKYFEVIIIDSPPVELVSDALVIATMSDSVIYVSRAEATPYQVARKGIQRIKRAGGKLLGVVLNQFDARKAEKYYGSYHGYGQYGYGKGGGYSSSYGGGYAPTYGAQPKV